MDKEKILREAVAAANRELVSKGLVFMTFGNASVIDSKREFAYIKPSGVDPEFIEFPQIVRVGIDGKPYGKLQPSVDTPAHIELYKAFPEIGGIVHTHSTYATIFAQAGIPIPCLGTTHADYFKGEIPITRRLREPEINDKYESNIGKVIAETFRTKKISPLEVPACLVMSHGPFVWGKTIEKALENALVLEKIAELAYHTLLLQNNIAVPVEKSLIDKHFLRKHGSTRYYGQGEK